MLLRAVTTSITLAAALVHGACSDSATAVDAVPPGPALPAGARQVERVQYNDVTDVYRVFFPGHTQPERIENAKLAMIPLADTKAGKEPYLAGDTLFLGSAFRIGLLHGVVEERQDDANRTQNVVVRMEKRWWTPFHVAKPSFATPQVYYPPPFKEGPIVGVGGSGPTREAAYDAYRRAYGRLPQAVELANEGYVDVARAAKENRGLAAVNVDAGPSPLEDPTRPVPIVKPDPASARDNRIVGARPGSIGEQMHKKLLRERRAARMVAKEKDAKGVKPKKDQTK